LHHWLFKPSDPEFDEVQGWNEKVPGIFPEAAVVWKLESKKIRRCELNYEQTIYRLQKSGRQLARRSKLPTGAQMSQGVLVSAGPEDQTGKRISLRAVHASDVLGVYVMIASSSYSRTETEH
jgi:hypothetical protein